MELDIAFNETEDFIRRTKFFSRVKSEASGWLFVYAMKVKEKGEIIPLIEYEE